MIRWMTSAGFGIFLLLLFWWGGVDFFAREPAGPLCVFIAVIFSAWIYAWPGWWFKE